MLVLTLLTMLVESFILHIEYVSANSHEDFPFKIKVCLAILEYTRNG